MDLKRTPEGDFNNLPDWFRRWNSSNNKQVFGRDVVLAGDSMTAWWEMNVNPATLTYNAPSGVVTVTDGSIPHRLWDGAEIRYQNNNYASTRRAIRANITRLSNTSFSFVIPTKPTDLPASPVASNFIYQPNKMSIQNWFVMLQMRNRHPFNVLANEAQNGDTSYGVYNRLDDVLRWDPSGVVMQLPIINDQTAASGTWGNLSEDESFYYANEIVRTILEAGCWLLLTTATPVASGESRATMPAMRRVQNVNKAILDRWSVNSMFFGLDAYRYSVDYTNASGYAATANVKTDNIHHSVRQAFNLAKAVENILPMQLLRSFGDTRPTSHADCYAQSSVTISSLARGADGRTVTATYGAVHNLRVGTLLGIYGAVESGFNGWYRITAIPSTTTVQYISAGTASVTATGTITAGTGRNLYGNPVNATGTGGGTLGSGITNSAVPALLSGGNVSGTATGTGDVNSAAGTGRAGAYYRQQITNGAQGNLIGIQNAQTTTLFVSKLLPNCSYTAECDLIMNSTNWANTPISEIVWHIELTDGTNTYRFEMENFENGYNLVNTGTEEIQLHLKTRPVRVPAGFTATDAKFVGYVRLDGFTTAATLTLEWGRFIFYQETFQ